MSSIDRSGASNVDLCKQSFRGGRRLKDVYRRLKFGTTATS